jgi:hypothetical protein
MVDPLDTSSAASDGNGQFVTLNINLSLNYSSSVIDNSSGMRLVDSVAPTADAATPATPPYPLNTSPAPV